MEGILTAGDNGSFVVVAAGGEGVTGGVIGPCGLLRFGKGRLMVACRSSVEVDIVS